MRKTNQVIIAFFLIPIVILSVLNIVSPVQVKSEEENRLLAQWPTFSLTSLFSGQYTMDIESYISDQFPFRQFLVNIYTHAVSALQSPFQGDVSIVVRPDTDIGIGEILESDITPATESWPDTYATTNRIAPSTESSGVDKALPSLDPSPAQSSPSPVPTQAPTPTPTPTDANIVAAEDKVITYSAVIIIKDRAMELYSFRSTRVERYITLIEKLHKLLPETRIIDLIAPTSVEFYAPDKYHSNRNSQENAIAHVYDRLPADIVKVDAYNRLKQHHQEYLYFRTDHHWTARGAYQAYFAFCESVGFDAVPLDAMKSGTIAGGFVGSLYRYTNNPILKNNPDFVEYFMPIVESKGMAYQSDSMTGGYQIRAVYPQVKSNNKYMAFIGGDHPLAHFQTGLENNRSIVVIKESFGNALVPYLTNHYRNVFVIDPRTFKGSLSDFVRKHAIDDVLITNYAFSISSDEWVNGFQRIIG